MSEPTSKNKLVVLLKDGTPFTMYEAFPKQVAFHESNTRNLVAIGSRNSGKAVHPDTLIPTPKGFVTMADLAVGDEVFDETGHTCKVAWKSKPHLDDWGTYKLTFDDGFTIVCGGHHEWLTITRRERDTGSAGSVKTTREITETIKTHRGRETNHRIPLAGVLQTPAANLPIDPYVLGVWLGDGNKRRGQITSADPFVPQEIARLGYPVKKLKAAYSYNIAGLAQQLRALDATERFALAQERGQCAHCHNERWIVARSLCDRCYHTPALRQAYPKSHKGFKRFTGGVLANKRIPAIYLTASSEQRLALLQGLMDTDGSCNPEGHVEFCNTNKLLAEAVFTLAASLGIKPGWIEDRAQFNGKDCGPRYRVQWTSAVVVFRLPRKRERLAKVTSPKTKRRYIVAAERIADTPLQCIEVTSASHLYLVGRQCVPTHNSIALRMDAHMRALSCPNSNFVLIRKTYKELLKNHIYFQGLPWSSLKDEMELLGGTFNASDYICHYPNGSRLFLSYVGHEGDALNLLGAQFTGGYFDEISTIPWDFFTKLSTSVRVNKGSPYRAVIRAATNPFGESAAEVNRYFVTKDVDPEDDPDYLPNEWEALSLNMEENPHIDPVQYRKDLASLPAYLKKAWLEGEFTDETALFDFRPRRDGRPYHVLEEIDLPELVKHGQIYRAIDLGWHPDPSYVLWIAHLGKRFVAFHELVRYKTIIPDLATAIREEEEKLGIARTYGTFIDPTVDVHTVADIRTNREIFEEHGIPVEPSVNNREMFASFVHRALAEEVGPGLPRLQIYRGTQFFGCPYLVKSLPVMRYDPKKPMKMADHKHDHPVVALAYFLISHASTDRRSAVSPSVPRWMRPRQSDNARWVIGNYNVRSPKG